MSVQVIEFEYEKSPQDVSKRELIVLKEPFTDYFGVDVSGLEKTNIAGQNPLEQLISAFNQAELEYNQRIAEILDNSFTSHRLRRFKKEKMKKVKVLIND